MTAYAFADAGALGLVLADINEEGVQISAEKASNSENTPIIAPWPSKWISGTKQAYKLWSTLQSRNSGELTTVLIVLVYVPKPFPG